MLDLLGQFFTVFGMVLGGFGVFLAVAWLISRLGMAEDAEDERADVETLWFARHSALSAKFDALPNPHRLTDPEAQIAASEALLEVSRELRRNDAEAIEAGLAADERAAVRERGRVFGALGCGCLFLPVVLGSIVWLLTRFGG